MYLYSASLAILIYFQLGLLSGVKVKNNYFEPNLRVTVRNDGSLHKSPTASPYPGRALNGPNGGFDEEQPLDNSRKDVEQVSVGSYHSHMEIPSPGGVAHAGEGINFYLRLGALGMFWFYLSFSLQMPWYVRGCQQL